MQYSMPNYSTSLAYYAIFFQTKEELLSLIPGADPASSIDFAMAYDTVWTSALLLNETLSQWPDAVSRTETNGVSHLVLSQEPHLRKMMEDVMQRIEFTGVTVSSLLMNFGLSSPDIVFSALQFITFNDGRETTESYCSWGISWFHGRIKKLETIS